LNYQHPNQIPEEVQKVKAIIATCFLLSIGWISSCATVYDVNYDYDQRVEFQSLKTYDWMPAPDELDMNEFVLERIKNATDAELSAKGLVKAPSAPDFHVVPHVSAQEKIEVNNWGYRYGPYDMYSGRFGAPVVYRPIATKRERSFWISSIRKPSI
jgi:hypothetical protein